MPSLQNTGRAGKLTKIFWTITKGEKPVLASNAKLYLEACDFICKQKSPGSCVEILLSTAGGLDALKQALRSDLSPKFITDHALPFLQNLMDPSVETLNEGRFLQQVTFVVVVPVTFWAALLKAHASGKLDAAGLEVFAWLCLQIVSSRSSELADHLNDVKTLVEEEQLAKSESHAVRTIAYRIEKVLRVRATSQAGALTQGTSPGGRHDNDFAEFRQISIYPTTDEFLSTEDPYLQRLDDVFDLPVEARAQANLDRNFRLLREDMLADLREDLQVAMKKKKGRRAPLILGHLMFVGLDLGKPQRRTPCAIRLACGSGINFPRKTPEGKKKFLQDTPRFLKHDSFGALCLDGTILAFGSLVRDIDDLLQARPVVGIRFADRIGLGKAIMTLTSVGWERVQFLVVETATFSYEPVLKRLQDIVELPLEKSLVAPTEAPQQYEQTDSFAQFVRTLELAYENGKEVTIPRAICKEKSIKLQGAQLQSLINGLKREVGQIQGPPGTGKSFIGALIILIILRLTNFRVVILSYTNHALDQFMEDLMEMGVSPGCMVRLGSKFTPATECTRLENYVKGAKFRPSREQWDIINRHKTDVAEIVQHLEEQSKQLSLGRVPAADILSHLEFSESDSFFWEAFQLPEQEEGFQLVGKNNQALTADHLYWSWLEGTPIHKLGNLASLLDGDVRTVWELPVEARREHHYRWTAEVQRDLVLDFVTHCERFNELQTSIDSIFNESKRQVLQTKRVIACTTTAAAMFQSIIKTANPEVVMVEEAGEILEAHVITALSPSVKQLILIGDHKQLRPKVNNYNLSIHKGEGYDLDVSLFERLINQGHHYTTLEEQHRSHPNISHLTRMLAYPELKDMPATLEREPVRGLPSRVVFVHHEHPEEELVEQTERRDPAAKGSKRNLFEARMVLKMVKYLGQQGYKTENMVVLTPYLGQLSLLRDTLRLENDPVLNDLDSHELLRAGFMPGAAAKVNKRPLRLSTIDNYQGEESDIVIASLTRSNAAGDIGFLQARERLVVLVSRARNGLVLFGNMETFKKNKRGGEMWTKFFETLKEKECLFDGVPVYCERHPERKALLSKPEDFDQNCPDGGCSEPCGTVLQCGIHICRRRCHRIDDHSKVPCDEKVQKTCDRGHTSRVGCSNQSAGCKVCAREDEENRRRIQRDLKMEMERQERQDSYKRQLQELEDEIDHERRQMKYESEAKEQASDLQQKKEHLKSLKDTKTRRDEAKAMSSQNRQVESSSQKNPGIEPGPSAARDEWDFMKEHDGVRNEALDELMGMIGLESVKDKFLTVKSSVDTKIRQNVSLAGERFSCSLLGNPGTGKTTVARLWAKFLTTVGAIAGSGFEETTGAKLANDGVKACENILEKMKNEGGGVLFIDEAYQLSSGNSPGGKAVMDYLLAEVENLRGKVVFVLAGYSKQMESFFAHNPGFPSRFPIEMKFEDYGDNELLKILQLKLNSRYKGRMDVEDGVDGLFFRIAARRVGYSRGKEGFGNARAVENSLAVIIDRQAKRLRRERRAKRQPNDLFLTKEDIIGLVPSEALTTCKAYQKLNELVGLVKVKENLQVLVDTLQTNYDRELAEEPLVEFSLNRVFLGSPGTGKTTVAKLYGQVLVDMGLLSNGEVVIKNPSDFVGSVLGQSEAQTKGILAATVGKVLVIDEAYGLYGGGSGTGDPYKTAVVDTIVAEVQSVPGEDRCVLLLGYTEQMEEMFQKVNPGLARRFPISSAFVFEDFDDDALRKILEFKLKGTGFNATAEAKRVALEVLRRARNRPNFGNAGEIDILLGKAKESNQKRASAGKTKRRAVLEAVDFDAEFERAEKSGTNVRELFREDVGREDLIQKLESYQDRVRRFKALDMDPEIPFNFLFRGPPGTGKTTTARKMGKVYYDMGFLADINVIDCSASDMIAQYAGQTGPKVRQLLDRALGRVLFIDEAYRLAEGHFAKEAVDELVDSVTKPRYQGKVIIILAGYENDINSLLAVNPGMSSRFPEVVDFNVLSPRDSIKLIVRELESKKKSLESKGKSFNISCLQSPRPPFLDYLEQCIQILSAQEGWANARDVKHLAKCMFRSVDMSTDPIILTEEIVNQQLGNLFKEREDRSKKKKDVFAPQHPMAQLHPPTSAPPAISTNLNAATAPPEAETQEDKDQSSDSGGDGNSPGNGARLAIRDAGVSDEVWEQLQRDKEEEDRKEEEYQELKKKAQNASDAAREDIVRQLMAEEKRRREEEARKKKLMEAGRCPMGFSWIKQKGGYRCAGGSHSISDMDVQKL